MMIFIKIACEFFILMITTVFSIPSTSFIFQYGIISRNKQIIFNDLIVILALVIIIRYVIEYKRFGLKKQNQKLSEAVKSYRAFISGFIDDELREISQKINHSKKSDRISVFLYSSSLDQFYSIGRYSASSKYNKVGRYIIEDEKEYLFSVLNEEDHYALSPKIKNRWCTRKKNRRNMQSQDMLGVPIFDEKKQNTLGVVVLQSTDVNRYQYQRYQDKIKHHVKELNEKINQMNIDPNTIASMNKTLEGL